MVRAILDGSKTQTRRIVKASTDRPFNGLVARSVRAAKDCPVLRAWFAGGPNDVSSIEVTCPYGQAGDQLWVRETWAYNPDFPESAQRALYRADPECEHDVDRWKPSIHIPRWASRITLEITDVRVERLQDITYDDALAEGIFNPATIAERNPITGETGEDTGRRLSWAQRSYRLLWESINGSGSWEANPWVWVVEFKRIKP